jgi:hypothetical protein
MAEGAVVGVAEEAEIRIEEAAFPALEAIQETVVGRTAVGQMCAAEEANGEAIRTIEVARTTGEVTILVADNIRRMRCSTLPLRMASATLPSLATRKHTARHSNSMMPTPSPSLCHVC